MATNTLLKLKKSSVSGRIPDSADLAYGELAINYTDGKLWYKHSAGGVRSFHDSASIDTLIDNYLNSDIVHFQDNSKLTFGNDSDLQIYSDGTNVHLYAGTADITITTDVFKIVDSDGKTSFSAVPSSGVSLFHADSSRLETRSYGVEVLGGLVADSATVTNDLDVGGVFTTITTDGLNEGSSNLYYTKTRTDSDISALVDSDYVAARTAVTDLVDSAYVANLIDAASTTEYIYQPDSDLTQFSDSDINGNVLSYDLNMIDVYLNGIRLSESHDYRANNGTSIVLLGDPIGTGDTLVVSGRQRVKLANGIDRSFDSDLTTTNSTAVDNFLMSRYRSAKYLVQMGQGGNYQVSELLVIHDGTNVYTTEYAVVRTNGSLGDISASTDGTKVYVNVAATNANTNIKINRLRIDA